MSTASKLVCAPITLPVVHGVLGGPLDAPPAAWDWQAGWQSCEVLFPSRLHGSTLYAVLFAPENIDLAHDKLPVVVIAPGSIIGLQSQYHWSARELASYGYIALTVDPQGVGNSELAAYPQTADNYIDAVVSALDFIESPDNPLRENADTAQMGAAGHSLSAYGLSWLQGEEPRLRALVAWDYLATTATGNNGDGDQIVGGEVPGLAPLRPVQPRIPAMGQSNDSGEGGDAEAKKDAYTLWRDAGVASMQISFLGKAHLDWSQGQVASNDSASPKSQEMRLFQYYTRAWFDLWLKNDRSAIDRLTATEVFELPLDAIYSQKFRSALFLPTSGIDCPDITAGSCPAFQP
ncbi:MAG: hypothetical protein AABY95_07000 [Pseudomonadota bacterium]